MRYIADILRLGAREHTDNQDYSVDITGAVISGIPTSLLLEYANDAQDNLQTAILSEFPDEFIGSSEQSIVPNKERYLISDRMAITNRIISLQYSSTGDSTLYEPLYPKGRGERRGSTSYDPSFYMRAGGGYIDLNDIPLNPFGKIRAEFYRELDDLDIRRAQVAGGSSTTENSLSSISLNAPSEVDANELVNAEYVCINDRFGNVLMYSIPVLAYSVTGHVITVVSGFSYKTGETIPVGAYVTIGKYSTTHSKLNDNCERYLKLYVQKRLLNKDASKQAVDEDDEVQNALGSILVAYSKGHSTEIRVTDWSALI